MNGDVRAALTAKNDVYACAFADKIAAESQLTDAWYGCFDEFAALLEHPKSLVRNRAMALLAANVQWDEENRFDDVLPQFLAHITDEKPITARQCVKSLTRVALARPRYIPAIREAMSRADLSKYKDSMRPLIEKDIAAALQTLTASAM